MTQEPQGVTLLTGTRITEGGDWEGRRERRGGVTLLFIPCISELASHTDRKFGFIRNMYLFSDFLIIESFLSYREL